VIIAVVLQNSMDLLKSEPGSSNESCVTSALDANEFIVIEDGRLSDISEEADQEATLIPAIKAEPNVSVVPVVSVTHICYGLCTELPAPISVGPCETKILHGNGF
jgi:hypothetical protein